MEKSIDAILFTTDLSEKSRQAFPYAANLACLHRARIIILHVLHEQPEKDPIRLMIDNLIGKERWKEIQENEMQNVKNLLIGKKHIAQKMREDVNVFCDHINESNERLSLKEDDIIYRVGPVGKTIIEVAEEKRCSMIVMGYARERKIIDRLVGNTIRDVLKRSPVPVLLFPSVA